MQTKISRNYLLGSMLLLSAYAHADSNEVVATINVGVTPAGIAITPNGKYAYVANNNNYGIAGQDTVSVLDLRKNTLKTTIASSSFDQPFTVTMNAAGTLAYVTNSNSTTINIIDTATNTVTGTIAGFDGPSGMVITPDGNTAYVNNYGGPEGVGSGNGTTVSIVDLNTNTITGAITVGLAPAALAISPNGNFVYVINYVDGNPGTGTMSFIATSTNTVVHTTTGFSGPFGISVTPSGKHAYVTNFGSNNFAPIGTTVSVVNLGNRSIVKTIKLALQAAGVVVAPEGHFVYVSNYNTLYAGTNFTNLTAGQGTVNIIDRHSHKVVPPTIAVGQSPSAIAISPNGKFAYVTNFTSNTVSVIKLKH
jgi:YVTN family beta-propeller protein